MKKADRFLIGIVIGIVLLVAIAVIVTLRQPPPTYQPEESPDGVAYNYLLALQQKEYARAYGYLSPAIPGYPANSDAFAHTVRSYSWSFRFDEDTAVSISDTQINGDTAVAHAAITRFSQNEPFGGNTTTATFTLELRREAGAWKIWSGTRYWARCWENETGCN
ncbi:MAG: hypothetical protein H6662_12875 [Ardenticatenaceae bacterium]|nr:hypothetical protein [Anaerolineales bacterium]MCB8922472.1 hypothetical protein [Ardenticatenaceae bacterium]MCB8989941.1 hypothetical protein [Ardenticatenaceae bacterium]MCB9005384.1 hypothetical protein [Ardenticatenaceae bacterium]